MSRYEYCRVCGWHVERREKFSGVVWVDVTGSGGGSYPREHRHEPKEPDAVQE